MNKVTRVPPIFEHEESEAEAARLDALAEAQIAAGEIVPHEKIVAWIEARKRGEKLAPPTSG